MIALTCTNCKKLLQIDDAFAGGVCRCMFCGTIQTVPSARSGRAASPNSAANAPKAAAPAKTLFQSSTHAPHTPHGGHIPPTATSGSGLDELAQIVASSGLAGTGLRSGHLRRSPPPAPLKSNLKLYIIAASCILGLAIISIFVWLIFSKPDHASNDGSAVGSASADHPNSRSAEADPTKSPNYMGLPLTGPSVIYLLDRGSGTLETFDYLKRGAIKSIASLGAGSKFQILFWETDSLIEFPKDTMRYATAENVTATEEAIKDVYAFQQSKIEEPLKKALIQNPTEIVIVTGKYGLDDEFVNSVITLRGNNHVKIHTVSLGKSGSPDALKKIADKTGGHFREVSGAALAEFGG